jgi:FkbM family methyltransferase
MSIDLVIGLYSGFHFAGELRMINRLAATITDGVIVAIGSYRGQSDCALAMHARVPVYCIDPRTPSDDYPFGDADRVEWMKNVLAMGCAAKVRPINLPSLTVASVWNEPISLLWIDGDHAQAYDDLAAWLPHVTNGGLLATHDSNSPMVIDAVAKFADRLELVERDDITYVYRVHPPTATQAPVDDYEPFTAGPLTLLTRRGVYSGPDKHAVQEVQTYPEMPVNVHTVIDAGAMIGAYSAWMKYLYPDARIFSLEPEDGNYALLQRNVADLPGVWPLHVALSYDPTPKKMRVDPINSGGHVLIAAESGETTTVTLETLMERDADFNRIDVLKLDVEYSEMDILLNARDDTLRDIHAIIGERHYTHDEFLPVIKRLESLGFAVTDEPHPELSVSPYFMNDRGIFTALNTNWTEPDSEIPFAFYGGLIDLTVTSVPLNVIEAITAPKAPPTKRKTTRRKR